MMFFEICAAMTKPAPKEPPSGPTASLRVGEPDVVPMVVSLNVRRFDGTPFWHQSIMNQPASFLGRGYI